MLGHHVISRVSSVRMWTLARNIVDSIEILAKEQIRTASTLLECKKRSLGVSRVFARKSQHYWIA